MMEGWDSGADELSSDAMSDLALLATSIAARPVKDSIDGDSDERLYSASNMRTSGMLQQIFLADLPSRFMAVSDPSELVPVIQARLPCLP